MKLSRVACYVLLEKKSGLQDMLNLKNSLYFIISYLKHFDIKKKVDLSLRHKYKLLKE